MRARHKPATWNEAGGQRGCAGEVAGTHPLFLCADRMTAVYLLYSLAFTLALLLSAPWWLLQMARTHKYRAGMRERLGRVPARLARPGAGARTVWIHAVSVGEVLAISRLVEELRRDFDAVYVSTTTAT